MIIAIAGSEIYKSLLSLLGKLKKHLVTLFFEIKELYMRIRVLACSNSKQ